MKKLITILSLIPVLIMSSCSTTQVKDIMNDPQFQAVLSQAQQFALEFATRYIVSHLGARKGTASYASGVDKLKIELMTKYGFSAQLSDSLAVAAFAKSK